MFAPVIHTCGAISSVRNALGVYLWLQNPPDRGGLIFMGSVNRDFVFAGRQAGRARRTVHTWNLHTRPGEEKGGGVVRAAGCVTVRWTTLSSGSRARAGELASARQAWEPYGKQPSRTSGRIPRVYTGWDCLIVCALNPPLLSPPALLPTTFLLASCAARWRSEPAPELLAPLSHPKLMMLFEDGQSAG